MAAKRKPKEYYVLDRLPDYLDTYKFTGSVSTVIEYLTNLLRKYPQYIDVTIKTEYDGYDSDDYAIYGKRFETKEEESKRKEANKKARKTRADRKLKDADKLLEKDLKEYARLKEKYD